MFAGIAVAVGIAAAGAADAGTVSISLGQSNENYVLDGQGPVAPGIGSFTNQQGDESYNGVTNTTTDSLTGVISGSNVAGLSSGDYDFITTYTGTPIGSGGMQVQSQSNPANVNYFYYLYLDPSVDMTLKLTGTPDGNVTIPLVTNGNFDGPGFSFLNTSVTCTGVAVCTQNNVGLTPGASDYGPVTISVSYTAVPEPSEWAVMLFGFGALGAAMRLHRKSASAFA